MQAQASARRVLGKCRRLAGLPLRFHLLPLSPSRFAKSIPVYVYARDIDRILLLSREDGPCLKLGPMLLTEVFKAIGPPPDGQLQYPLHALKPLFGIPSSWTQLLREAYSLDNPPRPITLCMVVALDQVIRVVNDNTWRMAGDTGFVSALGELVTKECLCGFTQEQLTSSDGQQAMTLVSCPISNLHTRPTSVCVPEPDRPHAVTVLVISPPNEQHSAPWQS